MGFYKHAFGLFLHLDDRYLSEAYNSKILEKHYFSRRYISRYHFLEKNGQKRYQLEDVLAYNTADNRAVSLSFNELGKISPVSTVR